MGKEKQVKETTLASEVIAEAKRNSKRWFIIALAGWIAALILAGAIIYVSYFAPVEDTTTTESYDVDQDSGDGGNNNNYIKTGDIDGKTKNKIPKND